MPSKINSLILKILNMPLGMHTWEFWNHLKSDTDLLYHILVLKRNTPLSASDNLRDSNLID